MTVSSAFQSISQTAPLICAGELTPLQLTEQLLQRIDLLNPSLHCYTTLMTEQALAAAEQATQEIQAGQYRGPLHGIPIALKDLIYTEDAPTGAGTTFLSNHLPRHNAPVVKQLQEAGAIILGKLTLTEGAMAHHHPALPRPTNPWHESLWTGVSSSGSGVATAAGLAYATLGSDTLGSIRFPSAANNIVGLKPTYNRINKQDVFPLANSLDHLGPMTRTVEDAAMMLAYTTSPQHYANGVNDQQELLAIGSASNNLEGTKIGWDIAYAEQTVTPDVFAALVSLADRYQSLGAEIVEIKFPDTSHLLQGWMLTTAVEIWHAHEPYFEQNESAYTPTLSALIKLGSQVKTEDYASVENARQLFTQQLNDTLDQVDLLLCPALPGPIPTWEEIEATSQDPEVSAYVMAYTVPFTYSGHPSLTLPGDWPHDASSLPVAHQLIGKHMDELSLLRAGLVYQRSSQWASRHPDL